MSKKLNWQKDHLDLGFHANGRSISYWIMISPTSDDCVLRCYLTGGPSDIDSDSLPSVAIAKDIAQTIEDMNTKPHPAPGDWWDPVPPGYLTADVLDAIVDAKLRGEEISFDEAERRGNLMRDYLKNPTADKAVKDIMEGVLAARGRGEKIDWKDIQRRIAEARGEK
jgi:hypothetical protein